MSPRTVAVLYRIARIIAALRRRETEDEEKRTRLVADLDRALRELDGLEPGWLERTPLWRSANDRKGKRHE